MKTFVTLFIAAHVWLAPLSSHANTLEIGTSKWPPYDNISHKEAPGFNTEVIRQVFGKMGIAVNITEEYPWKRTQQFAYTGKLDAVFSVFYTEERARNCHYPDESLIAEKHVLFIKKTDAEILKFDAYDDLRNKRIGTHRGAGIEEKFLEFIGKNCTVIEVSNEEQHFKMLADGRLDYVVSSFGPSMINLHKLGLTGKIVPILSKPIREDNLFIMFSKKTIEPEFVHRFSDTLKAFKQTEAFRKIHKKYFGSH
jgi:polar amino acid transport system substrate-binding protein